MAAAGHSVAALRFTLEGFFLFNGCRGPFVAASPQGFCPGPACGSPSLNSHEAAGAAQPGRSVGGAGGISEPAATPGFLLFLLHWGMYQMGIQSSKPDSTPPTYA